MLLIAPTGIQRQYSLPAEKVEIFPPFWWNQYTYILKLYIYV